MKIYKQETNISCGIACLRSIFSYYGKELTEKEIFDKTEFYKLNEGVANPIINLGVTALKFGFDVKYIGYNPIIANNNKSSLEESLTEKSKSYFDLGKFCVDKALEFLNLGGEIVIEKLNVEKLKLLIDNNKFILVGIRPAFIKNTSFNNLHKVIIDGYNEKGFHILDPSEEEYSVDFDSFLMAFYSAIPEALIIKSK
ncbi:MAG: hypothetical protein PWR30_477 [Candidatus Woesearchaeota archaeon]|nr:hypothetical protein [Candidatus Woesearchaeota archaeon]